MSQSAGPTAGCVGRSTVGILSASRRLHDVMTKPTTPESHRDLLESDIAVLATVGADGRPQLSAVWFLAEGDDVRISLNSSRQKVKNLRANRAVNLFILDRAAPSRYLEIRGDAEVVDDPDYAFAERVGRKYHVDLRSFDGSNPHRVLVTLNPTRINAVDMSAGR
jgi:PPOX class probable F420-dependent enzyme